MPDRKLPKPSEILGTSKLPSPSDILGEDLKKKDQRISKGFGIGLEPSQPYRPSVLKEGVKPVYGKPKPQEEKPFVENLENLLASGIDQFGTMVSSIPSGLVDLSIQMFGSPVLKETMDSEKLGKLLEAETGIKEEYNPLSPNNYITSLYRERGKASAEAAKMKYDGSIEKAIDSGDYVEAGKILALRSAQALPVTIGLIASRGAGASEAASLIGLGIGSQATEYQNLKEQYPDLDKNTLLLNSILTGVGEAGSELVGTSLLFNQASKLLARGAKEEAEAAVKTGVKSFLDNAFKKSFVGSAVLSDASGEMANQVWKNFVDKETVDPSRSLTDGVLDAGLISIGTTAPIAGGAKVASKILNPKTKENIDNYTEQIKNVNQELDNPNVNPTTKALLLNQISDLTEKVNDELDNNTNIYNSLSEPKKKEVDSIVSQIEELNQSLQSSDISESTKSIVKNQIDNLNTKLQDAVQIETAGQIPVQPEARVGEEVAQGEPQAKPQEATKAQEKVRDAKVFSWNTLPKQPLNVLNEKYKEVEGDLESASFPEDIDLLTRQLNALKRQIGLAESEMVSTPKEKITIGVAPFREINVTSLDQDTELRSTPEYKNYVKNILRVTKGLGLKVNQSSETWGGYVDTETGRPVQEVSNMLQIQATPEEARVLAAILGKTAPELQDSVLVGNFSENGTGAEHMIRTGSFDNATKAIEFLKKNGLEYFTIDKNTGDIIILDMDGSSADNIINFNKELNENGITTKHTFYPVEAEFVGRDDYDGILAEQGRRIAEERGIDIDAIVSSATKRFQKTRKQKVEPEAEVEVEIPQVIEEDATDLASKIRKLKVDLGKGALQSNIAGLPIAVYNSVVEFVATSVEAGMTIKQAIERAIEKYNLNKFESFDKDQMIKEIEVKNNPVYFDNIKKFASDSSFDNKIQFKSAIQNINKDYLPQLKSIYGKNFNPSEISDSAKKYLTDILTVEAFDAIRKHPEAIGWYDEKTTQALDTVSLIHPEIKTDPESRGAFILALAIMSNGNKVDANFDLAEKQYSYFKKNGRFETEGGFGIQQSGIKKSLEMINSILDAGLSMTDLNEFLTSKYRAGDLKVKIDGKIKNLSSGELANELVYGAVILGPKIGNGFYMNLWGKFDQLTMDRWFMRTWGRLTGTLIESNKERAAKAKNKFLDSLSFVKKDKDSLSLLESLIGKVSKLSTLDLAKAVKKLSMDKVKREKLSLNPLTDQLRRASNNLLNILDGEKEAPSNGAERKFIRDVFDSVQKRLKENYGIDITMADLQAVMWYPEKILYESFKSGESFDTAAEGYTSDEAPDYFNAAKKLAIKKGIDENKINKAITVRKRDTGGILGDGNKEIGSSVSITDQELAQRIKGAISGKKIADSVRSLKINLAKGGLQSNIAGLPIALYNSVIEFIATSIEAGDTVAQAIKKAIDKFKLRDIKSFNENELKSIIFEATGEDTGIIKRPAGKLARVREGIASIFRRKPKGEVGRALKPEEFTEFEEVQDERAVRDLIDTLETPFRNKEKLDKASKSLVSRFIKGAFESQYEVIKKLFDKGEDVGKIAVAALKNRKGYNGKSSIIFRQFSREIFDDLGYTPNIELLGRKVSERELFDSILNLNRIKNIDVKIRDKFSRFIQVQEKLKDKKISSDQAKELRSEFDYLKEYLKDRKVLKIENGKYVLGQYKHSKERTAASAEGELKLIKSLQPEVYEKLDNAYYAYTDAFRYLLEEQYKNNLISKAVYDELYSYNYIPTRFIQHFIENELSQDNPVVASKLSSTIKNLTGGSDSDVITNFSAILELYTNSVYKRIYENRAANSLARAVLETKEQKRGLMKTNQLVKDADANLSKASMYNINLDMYIDEPISSNEFGDIKYGDIPTGYDVIYFYRDNGKRERVVAAKDFVDTWYERGGLLSPRGDRYLTFASNKLFLVNLFKSLITKYNPGFGIYQITMDAPQAIIATQAYPDFIVGSVMLASDYASISKDIAKFVKDDELTPLFKEAVDAGIFSDFLSTENDMLVSQSLVNKDGSTDYKTTARVLKRKITRGFDTTLNSIAKFNEAIEYSTRLAVYKRMKQNLVSKYTKENGGVEPSEQQMFDIRMLAAEQARSVVDFSRSGTIVKPLNKLFAYLNAGMQAFYSSARSLKNNPTKAAILYSEIGLGATLVLASSLGVWGDEEEKKKRLAKYLMLSKYQRSNYFLIYNPFTDNPEYEWIRVVKPQAFRGYLNLIEQGYLNNVLGVDVDMELAKESFSNDLPVDIDGIDLLTRNPMINGIIKYSMNRDAFRNQEVVKNEEKIQDWAEGVDDKNVSKIYLKLGEYTRGLIRKEGFSPKRTQAFVESLIGDPSRNTTTAILDKAGKSMFYLATGNVKEIKNEFGDSLAEDLFIISGLKGRMFAKTPKLDASFMETLDEQRKEEFTKKLLIRSEISEIYENAESPQEAKKLANERLSELVKSGDIKNTYKKRLIDAQDKRKAVEGKPSWYGSLLHAENNEEQLQILEHYAIDLSNDKWNEIGGYLINKGIVSPEVTRDFANIRLKKKK